MKESFVVLSAGIEFNKAGKWQLDYWTKTRCDAALKLRRSDLDGHTIILTGGIHRCNRNIVGIPSVASLMRVYMVSKESSIGWRLLLEENSSTTYEQLYNIANIIHSKKCDVSLLSNRWHLPRITALLAYCPQLRCLIGRVKLVSVEAYMATKDASQEIIKNEASGVIDILCGSYKL
jgi:hypothetical protein